MAVIGAGISGLCVAYQLQKLGIHVTVLEGTGRAGGVIQTIHEDGWLFEAGPNTVRESTPLLGRLIDELGLRNQLITPTSAARKRFILRDGILHELPRHPISLLTSRLLSTGGKLRLLKEPIVGRGPKDESIAQFVERRLGREFLDYIANPAVAGVFAGRPEDLSMRAALPRIHSLEQRYGSILMGALASRRKHKSGGSGLFSFKEGLQSLPQALADGLGDSLRRECMVEAVIPMRAGRFPIYTVYYRENDTRLSIEANAVVLATPAYATAEIIRPIDPEMSGILRSIDHPPLVSIFLGFQEHQPGKPPDGFGFLVPEKEGRTILGCVWSSSLFPGRAPRSHVALTVFMGGSRQPGILNYSDSELHAMAIRDLKAIMKIEGLSVCSKVVRWEKGIPQYGLGYSKILSAIDRFEQNFQGAFLCANYNGGVSVGDCIENAGNSASRIKAHLEQV